MVFQYGKEKKGIIFAKESKQSYLKRKFTVKKPLAKVLA